MEFKTILVVHCFNFDNNFATFSLLLGQGRCHDISRFSDPDDCPANSYIVLKVATLQASIDAAITKV